MQDVRLNLHDCMQDPWKFAVGAALATPVREVHGLAAEDAEMVRTRSTLRQAVHGLEADSQQDRGEH